MVTVDLTRVYTAAPEIDKLLLHYFGRNPYYAQAKIVSGDITYQPVKQKLTEGIIKQHLDGKITLGSYHLDAQNTVHWIGWDVDSSNRDTARGYARQIVERLHDIPHAVEFSGSKGYHILIFLTEPMAAEKAKTIVEAVRGDLPKAGSSHVECYPKQAALSKALPMGSLLKLPLGVHPRSHERSRFIDINNGWESGQECDPIKALSAAVSPDSLSILLTGAMDPRKAIIDLMVPYWSPGERHNVALYLSGYLAHMGWGLEEVQAVIESIAEASNDDGIENRIQTVTDTFRNIEEGKTVKGFSGLNDVLPGAVLKTLIDLATQIITPTLVKRVDSVRLSKGSAFEKVRTTAAIIWEDLSENGEVIQTVYHAAYWYESDTHLLLPLQSTGFTAMLQGSYGINSAESFGKHVIQEIYSRAHNEGREVILRNKTVWDGNKLYVSLGKAEVYVLDGENIATAYNGECGFMFRTDMYSSWNIEPDFSTTVDVWDLLVKDISFNKSTDVPATPEEQSELLKAWILSFFFSELMPTKPLLLAIGAPGSGKTTAMRRLAKILESPDADVLSVVTDKQDSFRASLEAHRMIVLDNLENSGVRWLVDDLNRLATGSTIELRELFTTNEKRTIIPNVFVAMTAVNMPFAEDTLFSRILPLEMQALLKPLPEYLLQKRLSESMNGIWADLLLKLNQIVSTLKRNKDEVPPIASRLADFTVFCKRIEKSGVVNGAMLLKGLRSLVDAQKVALLEASPFIFVLEDYLATDPENAAKYKTMYEIYSLLESIARAKKSKWPWHNAIELGRHILTLRGQLEKLYQAEVTIIEGKDMFKVKFRSIN